MTFQPNNAIAPYLPTTVTLPGEDAESLLVRVTLFLNDVAIKVNQREISNYEIVETVTGQSWFTTNINNRRSTFRKVIQFPALIAAGTTSIAHGLGNVSGFTFTKIYGTARNAAGTLFVPLPQAAPDDVMITVDATNVNIIAATATYNGFSAIVVLEFLKS